MNLNWYALPLIIVISLVYSASRFERWSLIIHHAHPVLVKNQALLAGVLVILLTPPPILSCALAVGLSYAVGSIPFGLLAGKLWGVDIRNQGSGNIGATNAGRVLGWPMGVVVFGLDALKGAIATAYFPLMIAIVPAAPAWLIWFGRYTLPVLCGLGAILGHTFPLWLNFRGGKGVATSLGVAVVLAPLATILAAVVWVAALALSRYVSLASILAVLAFAAAYFLITPRFWGPERRSVAGFAVAAVLLVIWRHRDNIVRIRQGTEPQVHRPKLRDQARTVGAPVRQP